MKKILLITIALASVVLTGCSKDTKTNASAKEAEYSSINPAKDGFTVQLSSGGQISWDTDGWMSGDSVTLTAIGTSAAANDTEVILIESGKCISGKVETIDYGVVKVKSAGGFSADFLMTQEGITKVRNALDSAAKK